MMEVEFKAWPKTPRIKANNITITEKMDGTNACVIIQDGLFVGAQSRNRLITPDNDNMGFAKWAYDNAEELATLGDGYHYGEWVGPGIQKNLHKLEEKQFYLFNTHRPMETLPSLVKQVDVLYNGVYSDEAVNKAYTDLWANATQGDIPYTPEGIIVYFHLSRTRMKVTYANQDGKWTNG